jgi:hypothetical protein
LADPIDGWNAFRYSLHQIALKVPLAILSRFVFLLAGMQRGFTASIAITVPPGATNGGSFLLLNVAGSRIMLGVDCNGSTPGHTLHCALDLPPLLERHPHQ